jgi:MraZ protein
LAVAQKFEIYFGSYRPKIDGSYRILIPKEWRPKGAPVEFVVVPWPFDRDEPQFLMVLPLERYAAISKPLTEHSVLDDKMTDFKRALARAAKRVALDRFGRIALSASLLEAVGLKTEAELVGGLDHFEIWEPERLARSLPTYRKIASELKPQVAAEAGPQRPTESQPT